MLRHTLRDSYHCEFCDGYFTVPSLPKVLPCFHVICRDCILSLMKVQKSYNTYSDTENELYCPKCKKYIHLPPNAPDILPTSYKRIKTSYEASRCFDSPNCYSSSFGYCFDCTTTFCIEHSKTHIKRKHVVEIFKPGKFCLTHMKAAEMYCYTCQSVICGVCRASLHSSHTVSSLSLFYSFFMKDITLPKLYQNLRKVANCVTRITSVMAITDASEVSNILHDINFAFRMDPNPFCRTNVLSVFILPINATKKFSICELCGSSSQRLEIVVKKATPIPRPRTVGYSETPLIKFYDDMSPMSPLPTNESVRLGGELSIEVNEQEVVFIGKRVGDVLVEIRSGGVEIDNSPLRVRVCPEVKSFSTSVTSDKHQVDIKYLNIVGKGYGIVDSGNDCVKIIGTDFVIFGGRGSGKGQFKEPSGLCVGTHDKEEYIWVVDKGNSRIQMFNKGRFVRSIQREGKGKLDSPTSCVYVASEHLLYVTDTLNDRIALFGVDGSFVKTICDDLNHPLDIKNITVNKELMFVVTDTGNHRIVLINKTGTILLSKGGVGEERRGHFIHPTHLAIDPKKNEIYVTEGKSIIQKFNYNLDYLQTYNFHIGEITAFYYNTTTDVLVVVGTDSDEVYSYTQELMDYFVV
ncbi:nhl repeat-containing protein, putative [Entamoeba invadens IP1]|uniref:Nhl repeat-containing protein, putative n=1 Tax=Entamoeba invadens IP1 TaxID=370355 RepID=A0A0A1U1E1_ENTIV|nr:nhl repeat-containing protein, putative [Entamoeba invadens IP1]ELP87845.1 nhl repeat-containing protein, putative [Entamoeba invadens IP1]|eukprot:XP_004254616.1 nhl repeat-containing protein, putative [Entamoeba invadens IP1]